MSRGDQFHFSRYAIVRALWRDFYIVFYFSDGDVIISAHLPNSISEAFCFPYIYYMLYVPQCVHVFLDVCLSFFLSIAMR